MYKESIYNNYFNCDNYYYCYNSLSGALIKLNEGNSHLSVNDQSLDLQYLLDKGFIVPKELEEFARYNALMKEELYSSQSEIASYVIAITTFCNYKCIYCYEEECNHKTMSFETASRIVTFIKSDAEKNHLLKTIRITWFGGEPLLNTYAITQIGNEISMFAQQNNINFVTNIVTNGYLLDENNLATLNLYNLKNIQITLDGEQDYYNKLKKPCDVNAFDIVLNNIALCSQNNNVTIRLNTNKKNYESIKQLVKWIVSSRADINISNIQFAISRMEMRNSNDEISISQFTNYKIDFMTLLKELNLLQNLKSYLPKPRTIPCGLLKRSNFVIDSEGYLYKCEHYIGQPQYSVGDVSIGLLYSAFYSQLVQTPFDKKCETCSLLPICRGGCSQKRIEGLSSVSCEGKKKEIKTIIQMIIKG